MRKNTLFGRPTLIISGKHKPVFIYTGTMWDCCCCWWCYKSFFSSRSIHSHTKKHSVHTNIHTSCMRFLLDIFTMVLVGQFVHIVPIASICVTCYLLNYVQNLCIRKMIVATTTTRYFILLNENNNKNNSK